MTIQEKQSLRKKKSLLYLVDRGEYSPGYALLKTEELYDAGKLTEDDYNELADYLEDLLNKVEDEASKMQEESLEEIVETPIEESINEDLAEEVVENTSEE